MVSGVDRSGGRLNEECLKELLFSGDWQLFVFFDGNDCLAVCVTRLSTHSTGMKSVEAIIASGHDRVKWAITMRDTIAEFGRKEGCALLEMSTRPGWEREFRDMKKTHVLLEMRLDAP